MFRGKEIGGGGGWLGAWEGGRVWGGAQNKFATKSMNIDRTGATWTMFHFLILESFMTRVLYVLNILLFIFLVIKSADCAVDL